MWPIKLGQAFFRVLDGIEVGIYATLGVVLLVGSGIWIFTQVAEVSPTLAIVGAVSSSVVIVGAVVRDLIRRRLSRLTKVVLAAWMLSTFAAVAIDLILVLQS